MKNSPAHAWARKRTFSTTATQKNRPIWLAPHEAQEPQGSLKKRQGERSGNGNGHARQKQAAAQKRNYKGTAMAPGAVGDSPSGLSFRTAGRQGERLPMLPEHLARAKSAKRKRNRTSSAIAAIAAHRIQFVSGPTLECLP